MEGTAEPAGLSVRYRAGGDLGSLLAGESSLRPKNFPYCMRAYRFALGAAAGRGGGVGGIRGGWTWVGWYAARSVHGAAYGGRPDADPARHGKTGSKDSRKLTFLVRRHAPADGLLGYDHAQSETKVTRQFQRLQCLRRGHRSASAPNLIALRNRVFGAIGPVGWIPGPSSLPSRQRRCVHRPCLTPGFTPPSAFIRVHLRLIPKIPPKPHPSKTPVLRKLTLLSC